MKCKRQSEISTAGKIGGSNWKNMRQVKLIGGGEKGTSAQTHVLALLLVNEIE